WLCGKPSERGFGLFFRIDSIRDHGFQGAFITPDAVGLLHHLLGKRLISLHSRTARSIRAMSSASLTKPPAERVRVNSVVFYTSALLILVLTALLIAVPDTAGRVLGVAQSWLTRTFGWYYMLVICGYLLFVIVLAFSDFGKLKLGGKD